ncbi:MAG: hypothetical protein EZS28_038827 [Streblomastix strix]|uniref:Uncharacterized protein n=1 Tax=Streblomastix strix TaxID=222440 RepID=A0A5J4U4X0_9EUKA|nr:MAG: hypothetical protein EZS28_038827 [Streblomastix strix]
MKKLKRNKAVVVAAVIMVSAAVAVAVTVTVTATATVTVTVTVTASKYKKMGQGKETRQFREPMETRTGWKMMNATDRQTKRDRSKINENQTQRRSELKNPISLYHPDPNTQTILNIYFSYISTQHNTPHKSLSLHPQQHSPSHTLEVTQAILRTISPGDPRRYKEKEPERKQPKLQQYAGLMDVVERFHEIMKPIIEEEKKKPKVILPGQYKEYPNKDGPAFFYPLKNYRSTPILRLKDLNLSEEQWKQFDEDVLQGVVPFCL